MKAQFLFLFLVFQTARLQNDTAILPVTNMEKHCEVLTIDLCSNVGYTMTSIPNFKEHPSQSEAEMELKSFLPLIESNCSNSILQFLCGFYAPLCAIISQRNELIVLKPCRSLCRSVRAECEAILETFGHSWPVFFNCSLDTFAESQLCFGPSAATTIEIVSNPTSPAITSKSTTIEQSTMTTTNSTYSTSNRGITTATMSEAKTMMPPTVELTSDVNSSRRIMGLFHTTIIPSILTLIVQACHIHSIGF